MTKAIPSQVEEELSYLMNFGACSQRTEGETRTRRRRRKPKLDGAGEEAKKRRLTDAQVKFLEMSFGKERKLESGRKVHLASELGLDPKQVAVWFQNRRARHKSKQIEQEYLKLKSAHDTIIVEKCHLENEVLKLKKKLSEAEESVRKLSGAANGASGGGGGGSGGGGGGGGGGESGGGESGGSPTSSFSTVTYHPLVGEFGVEGEVDLMYIPEYNFNNYMDWGNLYGIL